MMTKKELEQKMMGKSKTEFVALLPQEYQDKCNVFESTKGKIKMITVGVRDEEGRGGIIDVFFKKSTQRIEEVQFHGCVECVF
jgi:hypothetical protein